MANDEIFQHGRYIFFAAGCISCHTVDLPLAGGRAIDSPFGTFYGPNITPHPEYGIGNWTQEDLIRALHEGISPEGEHYYPAFSYLSFTRMTRRDIMALYTYLMAQPSFPNGKTVLMNWSGSCPTAPLLHTGSRVTGLPQGYYSSIRMNQGNGTVASILPWHWDTAACATLHVDTLGGPLMNQYLAGTREGTG